MIHLMKSTLRPQTSPHTFTTPLPIGNLPRHSLLPWRDDDCMCLDVLGARLLWGELWSLPRSPRRAGRGHFTPKRHDPVQRVGFQSTLLKVLVNAYASLPLCDLRIDQPTDGGFFWELWVIQPNGKRHVIGVGRRFTSCLPYQAQAPCNLSSLQRPSDMITQASIFYQIFIMKHFSARDRYVK